MGSSLGKGQLMEMVLGLI